MVTDMLTYIMVIDIMVTDMLTYIMVADIMVTDMVTDIIYDIHHGDRHH